MQERFSNGTNNPFMYVSKESLRILEFPTAFLNMSTKILERNKLWNPHEKKRMIPGGIYESKTLQDYITQLKYNMKSFPIETELKTSHLKSEVTYLNKKNHVNRTTTLLSYDAQVSLITQFHEGNFILQVKTVQISRLRPKLSPFLLKVSEGVAQSNIRTQEKTTTISQPSFRTSNEKARKKLHKGIKIAIMVPSVILHQACICTIPESNIKRLIIWT